MSEAFQDPELAAILRDWGVAPESANGETPAPVFWLTGLSGAGKTTLTRGLAAWLEQQGVRVVVLDGDDLRRRFRQPLGFARRDREEQIRRAGALADALSRAGRMTVVALISPYAAARRAALRRLARGFEIFVDTPLGVCEARDPKGLYRKARAGEIASFTGIDDPYEPPEAPDFRCPGWPMEPEKSLELLINFVKPRMSG
jgi:adenylylsulfate kinase